MNPIVDRRYFLGGMAAALGAVTYRQVSTSESEPLTSFQPDTLFLTWQRDPTTTITMQWICRASEIDHAFITYKSLTGTEWQSGPMASTRPFPVVTANPFRGATGPTDLTIFRAELTGLKPGTEYEFRIGDLSPSYRFRTMPAKATQTFSFISGGDCGVNPHALANNRAAANQDPMFVMIGGDLGYDNGLSGLTALQFVRNYATTMIDTEGRLIPLVTAVGNHEVRGGYSKSPKDATFFSPLFDGLFQEHNYATLDFGDYLSLILLDSGHTAPIAGEQTKWLEKSLKDRVGRPHVFPINHVPCYPSFRPPEGLLGKFGTGEEQRRHWVPLFEKYEISVVLEHHDHTFKRTRPLSGGKIDPVTGVTYLGDGSWGMLRVPKSPELRSYLDTVSSTYHMTLHRLEGEQRFHVALGETGMILDLYRTGRRPSRRTPGVTS